MWIVTVSFKNCEHQVVLRYKTEESLKDAINAHSGLPCVYMQDDFGATAHWQSEDVVSTTVQNLILSTKGKSAELKLRARAQQDLKEEMLNDPALEFIPERKPFFGRS